MPTIERYTLSDLQQAVLDVLAEGVPSGNDDLTSGTMNRAKIIHQVRKVPGQDDANGSAVAPSLNALKRRGLVAKTRMGFHITTDGLTYVDLDGEPEDEPEVAREGRAEVTHIDPETRRVILDDHERDAGQVVAPQAPSRDEQLTRAAMKLDEWPEFKEDNPYVRIAREKGPWVFSKNDRGEDWAHRDEWLARRAELINKPGWDDAPEWAQGLAQDADGRWQWLTHPQDARPYDGRVWLASYKQATASHGTIPAGHDWRETLEARPVTQAPSRDELLTKLAMELCLWPRDPREAKDMLPRGFYLRNQAVLYPTDHADGYLFERREWEGRRVQLRDSSADASSTACDDQHRPEPAEPEAELEADLFATRDAIVGMEQALEELDEARAAACGDCGKDLTAEEVTYYGYQCEACVLADHEAMQADMEEGAASEAQPAPATLARFDELAELNASYQAAHAAPASPAPEVTILSVAVHPPGTQWLDSQETVIIRVDDLGGGPFLSLTTDGGPPTIESLAMLEAVTNTAFSLLREAEAREVAQ